MVSDIVFYGLLWKHRRQNKITAWYSCVVLGYIIVQQFLSGLSIFVLQNDLLPFPDRYRYGLWLVTTVHAWLVLAFCFAPSIVIDIYCSRFVNEFNIEKSLSLIANLSTKPIHLRFYHNKHEVIMSFIFISKNTSFIIYAWK